ncbi:hypothetical protein YC2023_005489 [Brassica napus]
MEATHIFGGDTFEMVLADQMILLLSYSCFSYLPSSFLNSSISFICIHSYAHIHTYIHSYAYIHTYIHCKSSQQDQWLLRLLIAVVMADQGQMFVKETSFDNCTTGCDDSTIKSSHEKAAYGASSRLVNDS